MLSLKSERERESGEQFPNTLQGIEVTNSLSQGSHFRVDINLGPLLLALVPPAEVGDAGDVVGGEDDVRNGRVRAQLLLRRERDHLLHLKTRKRRSSIFLCLWERCCKRLRVTFYSQKAHSRNLLQHEFQPRPLQHAWLKDVESGFLPLFVVKDVVEAVCESAGEVGVLGEAAGAPHREWVRESDAGNLLKQTRELCYVSHRANANSVTWKTVGCRPANRADCVSTQQDRSDSHNLWAS